MRFLMFLILIPILGCSQNTSKMVTEKEYEITVSIDDTFVIALESQIGTGYTWEITEGSKKNEFLSLLEKKHIDADKNTDGNIGADNFTFKALKKGKTEIVFTYKRPWEKDAEEKGYCKKENLQDSSELVV